MGQIELPALLTSYETDQEQDTDWHTHTHTLKQRITLAILLLGGKGLCQEEEERKKGTFRLASLHHQEKRSRNTEPRCIKKKKSVIIEAHVGGSSRASPLL